MIKSIQNFVFKPERIIVNNIIDYFFYETNFFEKELRPVGRLVAVFSPYRSPQKIFDEDKWENVAMPFEEKELFSRVRMGPYLEVYQLNL